MFASIKARILAGVGGLMIVALAICYIGWTNAANARDDARDKLAAAEAELVLTKADLALKQTAAEERADDEAEVQEMREELVDAIREVPDTVPDDVRVRLGCERLRRRANSVGADLPDVCRPEGGTEARPGA